MTKEEFANILLNFFLIRINNYMLIAVAIMVVIAIIAFFTKRKAIYPVPVSRAIGLSYMTWLILSLFNIWNTATFIIFCGITLFWDGLLVFMGLKND